MRFFPQPTKVCLAILAVSFFSSVGVLLACQVPVFRYALERWSPDRYEMVVISRQGGLTESEAKALSYLESTLDSGEVPMNLMVRVEEGASSASESSASLYYPGRRKGRELPPIWEGAISTENVRKLIDSPTRRELATRILNGESAIWVLVECGDKSKDDAAAQALADTLPKVIGTLKLPEGVIGRDEALSESAGPIDRENILQSDVPLKIDFSVVHLNRADPAEAIFLSMFLNLEDDLSELASEPMVFPVFGRGRVLEPLVGRGVTEGNIFEYAGYLCGACSCEVKDQNPGMDLLMAVNWDEAIAGSQVIIDKVLPPLTGVAELISLDPPAEEIDEPVEITAPEGADEAEGDESVVGSDSDSKFESMRLVIGATLLIIGIISGVMLRNRKS